jgi:Ca2+-binding EF-hand superfamily protein
MMETDVRRFAMLAAVAAAAVSGPLASQNKDAPKSRYDPATFLLANLRAGTAKEVYLQNLLDAFRTVDTDRNGLDREDIDRWNARLRDAALRNFEHQLESARIEIAAMDANADGGLTEKEIVDALEYRQSGQAEVDAAFERLDPDRDGLIAIASVPSGSDRQAQTLAEADRNRDGNLSREELLAAIAKARPTRERPRLKFAEWDIDGDGVARPEELAARYHPDRPDAKQAAARKHRFDRLFVLDADGNASVSEAELSSALLAQFGRVDRDGDGIISAKEEASGASLVRLARSMVELPFCALPSPSPDTDVLAVFTREGQLASTVSVAGQDRETSIVDVRVEPGTQPLFVLLLSEEPVIWDFQGDTQRIAQVVAFAESHDTDGQPFAGVMGLPQSKITFGRKDCLPVNRLRGYGSDLDVQIENKLGAMTGLAVRAVADNPAVISLPSLSTQRFDIGVSAPDGFDPAQWWAGTDTHPRGIAERHPAAIVAATRVEPYDLLPGDFGIARLVHQGVLAPTKHDNEFRLLKPLERFPGGLGSGMGINFVLGKGMSRPKGALGRGCLYGSDGKTVMEGEYCMQHPRGNSVQVRVTPDGKSCLFRSGGENAGCFPEDGRGLRLSKKGNGRQFEPVPEAEAEAEAAPIQTVSMPKMAAEYHSPVEIIPVDLRQRW